MSKQWQPFYFCVKCVLHYSALSSLFLTCFLYFIYFLASFTLVVQILTACCLFVFFEWTFYDFSSTLKWHWDVIEVARFTCVCVHCIYSPGFPHTHTHTPVNEYIFELWVQPVSGAARRARFIMDKDDFRAQVVVLVQIWSEHAPVPPECKVSCVILCWWCWMMTVKSCQHEH